ncbi:hypothetical protein JS565_10425 [Salmonella enterica subsp. enterica serovar Senftenberg]|nr:hypothetical protein [Salmonella enterica subsp. enterica serovar Senftenberg]
MVGCANELNAAYAADGYARMSGAGALLTTFGAENLALLTVSRAVTRNMSRSCISSARPSAAQQRGELMHHTSVTAIFVIFIA